MQTTDLRQELESRIQTIQREIDRLKQEKVNLDSRLQNAESQLNVWREAYRMESERLGMPSLPLFTKGEKSYRFAGMRIGEAVDTLRKENPEITKGQIREILDKEGFNFRGKNPGQAIHFAWIALNRRKSTNE